MRQLNALTGMRGVAALLVVLYHTLLVYDLGAHNEQGLPGFNWGWMGVDFFFVLSAFLLSLPLVGNPTRSRAPGFWRTYLAKRFLRIAPPYYASIVITIALFPFVVTSGWDILSHVLYLHAFDRSAFFTINPVYWTLALEFQLYLVLPFLVRAMQGRRMPYVVAGALLLSVAWRAAVWTLVPFENVLWLSCQLPGFLGHVALGIMAARLFARQPTLTVPRPTLAAGAFCALILAPLVVLGTPDSIEPGSETLAGNALLRPLIGLGFAVIVFAMADGQGWLGRLLASRPVRAVGEASYSLYLFHLIVMAIFIVHMPWVSEYGFMTFVAISVATSLLAAGAAYYLLERPSLRLKDVLVQGRARKPAPTPSVAVHPVNPMASDASL